MTKLYHDKTQQKLFRLHKPIKIDDDTCEFLEKIFPKYQCYQSYELADVTRDFNCIGWAIGVNYFIDPNENINLHYHARFVYANIAALSLYQYDKSVNSCMEAVKTFFDQNTAPSVLANKYKYQPTEFITYPPADNTIAFYFKSGRDQFKEEGGRIIVIPQGFSHAARYVSEVDNWVSDVWTSKLGQHKLVTHKEVELTGETYGEISCYLVPTPELLEL